MGKLKRFLEVGGCEWTKECDLFFKRNRRGGNKTNFLWVSMNFGGPPADGATTTGEERGEKGVTQECVTRVHKWSANPAP